MDLKRINKGLNPRHVLPCAAAFCVHSVLRRPGRRCRSCQPSSALRSPCLRRRISHSSAWLCWTWSLENSSAGPLHSVPPSDPREGKNISVKPYATLSFSQFHINPCSEHLVSSCLPSPSLQISPLTPIYRFDCAARLTHSSSEGLF